MSRGLPEYEALHEADGTRVALTLLRAVGWLSRGDLSVIEHAVGPIVPTPGAQEMGGHRFEYAISWHHGGWAEGEVLAECRRYAAPPIEVRPSGSNAITAGVPLVEIAPSSAVLTTAYPAASGRGLIVRVLNATDCPVDATLRPAMPVFEVAAVDPTEQPLPDPASAPVLRDGRIHLPLRAWEIATVLIQ